MKTNVANIEPQATLTFWIPERADTLLAAYEHHNQLSRSEALRIILRQYLYGLCGSPDMQPPLSCCGNAQSRGKWGGRMAQFGKNTVEVKLMVPRRWHEDLSALASYAGITRSHFAREVVAQHMLGHALLPERAMEPEIEQVDCEVCL
ncbi:MAG: hypothetical protein LBE59_08950 [Nevskiaceae bacterium]|jgi:hypothetical protein|nr:hypothetical protein [Nevskiaceae bacterium]